MKIPTKNKELKAIGMFFVQMIVLNPRNPLSQAATALAMLPYEESILARKAIDELWESLGAETTAPHQ
jgi:hypothetical protein